MPRHVLRQRGASLVEAVVVLPTFLFVVLALMQAAQVYYAKSNLNYATYEAVRAGTLHNASVAAIQAALQRALVPYYGGGRSPGELSDSVVKAAADLGNNAVRVEILSPTQQSFEDYHSPRSQAALDASEAVIPNVGLEELRCPREVPGCNADPASNASGQTLLDANLLKVRITYGIPERKQMPLVGRFYTWALDRLGAGHGDTFKQALIDAHRIPVVTHAVMRMQSDAIRNGAMVSSPGPGNAGKPIDPGPPGTGAGTLPDCPWWDPTCSMCPMGSQGANCTPEVCTGPG